MLEKLLEKLGLSEKDAKVYLATLELGHATVQDIAKKAKVVRPTAYVILEKLMKTGLVSTVTEGKKTKFVAENPQELANLLEEQKHQIDIRAKELDESMNQLQAIYNASGEKPAVRYFEGAEGLVALDKYGHDKLKPNSTMYTMMPIDLIEEQYVNRRKDSLSNRVKLGIKSKTIYTRKDGPYSHEEDRKQLREGIYLSREQLPIDATITIYPEFGVKLYYFGAKPYGVMLESSDIARNFEILFLLAWNGARQKNA